MRPFQQADPNFQLMLVDRGDRPAASTAIVPPLPAAPDDR